MTSLQGSRWHDALVGPSGLKKIGVWCAKGWPPWASVEIFPGGAKSKFCLSFQVVGDAT